MKNSKICLVILCLLGVSPAGTPQSDGATFCMENEIWKDIQDFEGFYQVSDQGRIKGLDRTIIRSNGRPHPIKEKILVHNIIHGGYHQVGLRNGSDPFGKNFLVSRLVAIHFIPNPLNLPEVNHKFGNKDDNRAISLEWTTRLENIRHAYSTGLNFNKFGAFSRNAKPVLDTTTGIQYGCIADALHARGLTRGGYMSRRHRNRDNMGIIFL